MFEGRHKSGSRASFFFFFLNGGVANTQPDYDCAKTLFDSYITVRSRSDMLNANAVTDDRVTGKWFFLLPY